MAQRQPYSEPDLVHQSHSPYAKEEQEELFERHSKREPAVKKPATMETARDARDAMRKEIELRKITHPDEAGFLGQLAARLAKNDEAKK